MFLSTKLSLLILPTGIDEQHKLYNANNYPTMAKIFYWSETLFVLSPVAIVKILIFLLNRNIFHKAWPQD